MAATELLTVSVLIPKSNHPVTKALSLTVSCSMPNAEANSTTSQEMWAVILVETGHTVCCRIYRLPQVRIYTNLIRASCPSFTHNLRATLLALDDATSNRSTDEMHSDLRLND